MCRSRTQRREDGYLTHIENLRVSDGRETSPWNIHKRDHGRGRIEVGDQRLNCLKRSIGLTILI